MYAANAPAVAAGIRTRRDQAGHVDRRLWVLDGGRAVRSRRAPPRRR